MSKTLLFLESLSDVAGGQKVFLDLAKGLREKYNVAALLPGAGPLAAHLDQLGIRYHLAPMGNYSLVVKNFADVWRYGARLPFLIWLVLRLIRAEKVDLVYANSARTFVWGTLAAALAGKPMIWHLHSILADGKTIALLSNLGKSAAVKRLICVCEAARSQFSGLRSKSVTIYNGIDTTYFRPMPELGLEVKQELGLAPSGQIVGIIGDLIPLKGQHIFLNAARRIADQFQDVVFLIVGSVRVNKESVDYEAELHRLTRDLGLESRVIFMGYRSDIHRIINALDILIVCSSTEATSLVLQEAMMCGRPVVSSRVGGIPELIQDGFNGFLYDFGDDEELARQMLRLLLDRNLMTSIGQNARHLAETRFDAGLFLRGIEREIAQALN